MMKMRFKTIRRVKTILREYVKRSVRRDFEGRRDIMRARYWREQA
jgi:hypothetical protein